MLFTVADGFRSNIFTRRSVIDWFDNQPYIPQGVSNLFPWNNSGSLLTTAAIEMTDGDLSLIPSAPRGAPGKVITRDRRSMIPIQIPHFPQTDTIMADAFRGVTQVASEMLTTMEIERDKSLLKAHDNNLAQWEYSRVGAITGYLWDYLGPGTEQAPNVQLINWFDTFGISQEIIDLDLTDSTLEAIAEVTAAKELGEDNLGNTEVTGWVLLCGKNFYRKYTTHPTVKKAFDRWNDGAFLREDMRAGFMISSDVTVVAYTRGKIGNITFIADDEAYLCPVGSDIYHTVFGPGTGADTLGVLGEPEYTSFKLLDHNEGVEFKFQTNPLSYVKKLKAFIRIRNRAS